jgi:uncharacterized protein YozE (UPF0346 family)
MTTFATPFYRWLLLQLDRTDPVGDIARAMRDDPAWPKRTDALPRLDRYLVVAGATPDTRKALRRAYGEWLIATVEELR